MLYVCVFLLKNIFEWRQLKAFCYILFPFSGWWKNAHSFLHPPLPPCKPPGHGCIIWRNLPSPDRLIHSSLEGSHELQPSLGFWPVEGQSEGQVRTNIDLVKQMYAEMGSAWPGPLGHLKVTRLLWESVNLRSSESNVCKTLDALIRFSTQRTGWIRTL